MTRFVGPSYNINWRRADVQRSVNMYVRVNEAPGGKSPAYLDAVPGLDTFSRALAPLAALRIENSAGYILQENGGRILLEP